MKTAETGKLTQDERPNIQRYPMLSITVYIPTFTEFDLICRLYTSIIISCIIVNYILTGVFRGGMAMAPSVILSAKSDNNFMIFNGYVHNQNAY